MSARFARQTSSVDVKIEKESDDEESKMTAQFLSDEWNDIPVSIKAQSRVSKNGLRLRKSLGNVSKTSTNCVEYEPPVPMDWNSHLSELSNQADLSKINAVQDFLRPWISVDSEMSKVEKAKAVIDGVNHIDKFESWRPTLRILPKPGNIYFCRGQFSDRAKFHATDGLSWISCGGSIKSNRVHSFYYVATPNMKKMTHSQKAIYCCELTKVTNQISTKKITYRKTIDFHERDGFFMIKYSGDDKLLPWLPRKHLKIRKKRLLVPKKQPHLEMRTKAPAIARRTPATPKAIQPPVESSSNVCRAVVFKTVDPLFKMSDPKEINDLLSRNPFGTLVNDAKSAKIMNPRAGELFMMNLSNLDSWSGVYHCDLHNWRLRNIQNWKDYGFITFHFTFLKHSEPLSEFKKTIHYNALTKMKLIQYHGSDAGVPGSEQKLG